MESLSAWGALTAASCPFHGRLEAGHSIHVPFPGVKTMRWDQLLSGAMAQVRPEPRENTVLGYKLTCGRAVPLENQVTPCKVEHNRPVEKLKLCAITTLQWQEHINPPQATRVLAQVFLMTEKEKQSLD